MVVEEDGVVVCGIMAMAQCGTESSPCYMRRIKNDGGVTAFEVRSIKSAIEGRSEGRMNALGKKHFMLNKKNTPPKKNT